MNLPETSGNANLPESCTVCGSYFLISPFNYIYTSVNNFGINVYHSMQKIQVCSITVCKEPKV